MEEKLSNSICSDLLKKIVSREIDDRTFLTENDLAKQYGVSKAPVRDALHLLCNQGYLVSYPRKGYMVRLYTLADIHKMQQVRLHLEKLSVELAIQSATDEEINALRQFNKEHIHATDPRMTNNTQFHMGLAEISGNPFLPETLQGLINNISRFWIHVEFDFEQHNALIDALLRRDVASSLTFLEKDILVD